MRKFFSALPFALIFAAVLGTLSFAQFGGPGVNSVFNGVWNFVWEPSTGKATYSATEQFVPAVTQRQFLQINGSATKTIRIRRVLLDGTAIVGVVEPVYFNKVSTAMQGAAVVGSSMTATPLDSSASAATAVVEAFNVSPATDPTVVGEVMALLFGYGNAITTRSPREFFFGQGGSALILRSASEGLSLNMAGTAPAAVVTVTVEWTEE